MEHQTTDSDIDAFERRRARLFGVAYRMLGTVEDAEDILQETWLRWQRADATAVRAPSIETDGERLTAFYRVLNPDKLRHASADMIRTSE